MQVQDDLARAANESQHSSWTVSLAVAQPVALDSDHCLTISVARNFHSRDIPGRSEGSRNRVI